MMAYDIDLLLEEKARPLFMGRKLLERISYSEQKQSEAFRVHDEEILLYIIASRMLERHLTELSFDTDRLADEDYKYLNLFPLFLDENFVKRWEGREATWSKYPIYSEHLKTYRSYLEGHNPSEAYQIKDNISQEIWRCYFTQTPISELIDIVRYSTNRLKLYYQNRKNKSLSAIHLNCLDIDKILQLNKQESEGLFVLNVLFYQKYSYAFYPFYEVISKFHNHKASYFFEVIENAMSLEARSLTNLFTTENMLLKSRIIRHFKNCDQNNSFSDAKGNVEIGPVLSYLQNPKVTSHIQVNYPKENSIISSLIKLKSPEHHPIEQWNYLKDTLTIWCNQFSQESTQLVLSGGKGCGKTSLAHAILHTLNKVIVEPLDETEDSIYMALILGSKIPNSCLICDQPEKNETYNLFTKVAEKFEVSYILIVDDKTKLSTDSLARIDFFYDMNKVPFESRLAFAKSKIADGDLAIKIAQQLKDYGKIAKAAKLVKSNDDWHSIYPHLAINNSGDRYHGFEIVDFNNFQEIPPFIGYDDISEDFNRVLNLIEHPSSYERFNVQPPKGFIIHGAPGTGKTLFVKQLIKNAKIPLISASSSELSKNLNLLKDAFDMARQIAPCILFFDEIDILIGKSEDYFNIPIIEKQQILNTMLTEIDGIYDLSGVIIIGTTNHQDKLAPAAIRAGRLSELIEIGEPDYDSLYAMWQYYLSQKPYDKTIDIKSLAYSSHYLNGSEIAAVVTQSALLCIKQNCLEINLNHINEAMEIVLWGRSNNQVKYTEENLKRTAVHEVGHAIVSLLKERDVGIVSIVPRKNFAGITKMIVPEADVMTIAKIEDIVDITLGGIVAEKIIYDNYTLGGSGDLKSITNILVSSFIHSGMSLEFGLSYWKAKEDMSEARQITLEKFVDKIIARQFDHTEKLLKKYKDLIIDFSNELYTAKSIGYDKTLLWKKKLTEFK